MFLLRTHSLLLLALSSLAWLPVHAEDATNTMPTVTVTAPIDSEESLVGPYDQPEWTEHRRFSTTRVYIQKEPWEIGFEQWWRARSYDNATPVHRFSEELEIGLPNRFQLDLYWSWAHEGGRTRVQDEYSIELRYALADWGKIPFNPTLYIEYAFVDHNYGGDVLESKILFGDDLGKYWHWGLNFIFETELSHELNKGFTVAGGLSRTIIDQTLSAGVEWQYKRETIAGQRSLPEIQFEIGPSIQWRPSKNTHLDLVALFGTTNKGPAVESFVVFGWDFRGASNDPHYVPTSSMLRN